MQHELGRFVALGHDFAIATSDAGLANYLAEILASLSAPGPAASRYEISVTPDGWTITWEDQLVGEPTEPGRIISTLLWHINRQVLALTSDRLIIHAGGVEREGAGLLLPGIAEAGKSTLVAGLVMRGFRYLSDEAVALVPETLAMEPYPKPITLDPGSWAVLPQLQPHNRRYTAEQWHIDPQDVRASAVSPGCMPTFLVATSYQPTGETELKPVSKSKMATLLAGCAFFPALPPRRAFRLVADVVRRCDCYELSVASLQPACALLEGLTAS